MAKPKGGLGRGLDSLFEDIAATGGGEGEITRLPLREIEPDPGQPRKTFEQDALNQLADSIAENGLLQPIAVRPNKNGSGYTIIAGERRWRASRLAGLAEVPVVIKEVSDQQAMELALIENLQREDLDPVEEALGCKRLMEEFGLTQEQTARRLGKSRSALANTLRLLGLPGPVLDDLKAGAITPGHAKAILSLPSPELMEKAAAAIIGGDLNVRQAEALCKKLAQPARPKKPAPLPEALPIEVESSLREVTGNEVKVDYKKGRGTLTLHFYSDDQLRAFANLLGRYEKE